MDRVRQWLLGFTSDGRARYAADYGTEASQPTAGGLDPDSDDQIDASADDSGEREYDGSHYLTTDNVRVYSDSNVNTRRWGAIRFHNGPFPAKGSTIDVAHFIAYIYSTDYDNAKFDIHAEDGAAPATFTTAAYNITGRARTTAFAAWIADAIAAGGIGWFNSPSIVDVIQELVTDYDCTAIALILKPYSDASKELRFQSWDEASHVLGAKLHLEWTEEAPPTGQPTMRRFGGIPGMRLTGRDNW